MPVLQGIDRHQITFASLDQLVASDSDVRLIDVFVDQVDLSSLELKEKGESKEGRSAFSNAHLLNPTWLSRISNKLI